MDELARAARTLDERLVREGVDTALHQHQFLGQLGFSAALTAEVHLEHRIMQYPLEQGALEIEYIEEFFGEYQRRKTPAEIVGRLRDRHHLILMATAPLSDGSVVPVSYKVAHEIRLKEDSPKLADLVARLRDVVEFDGRKILYTWIGGTRRDWRGQGHFRALTEQQEAWAISLYR